MVLAKSVNSIRSLIGRISTAKRLKPHRLLAQKERMIRIVLLPGDVEDPATADGLPTDLIAALVSVAQGLIEVPVITT